MMRRVVRRLIAATMLAIVPAGACAQGKIVVAANFTILADFARNVGGDRVEVTSVVGPDGDVHSFVPSPADAKKLADAKLVILNGLGLEGATARFLRAAAKDAKVVVASDGVTPLRPGSEADPHAWQSVANAKIYVANIRDALIAVDPADKAVFEANAAAYLGRLDALDAEVKAEIAKIPPDRRKLVTTHDAFGYFGTAYGVAFIAPHGVSTEAEASARDVARIIAQIRAEKIPAVFLENVTDPRLLERIAHESGARVGGTLYSDALTDTGGRASTYIDMMRHNVKQLVAALTG
jgi:zinc/manganese transport system substrate-binding protein